MDQVLLVLTNLPDEQSAMKLARQLVEKRLAACVNILPSFKSIYRWQGVIEEAVEISLQIKTTCMCYAELESEIRKVHPYQVPEIVAVPIVNGLPDYLDWIKQQTIKVSNV